MNHQLSDLPEHHHPFDYPLELPLYSAAHIVTAPVLVVAPHPDDETLGCGGAIAELRALRLPVWILVISDGTMSHPNSVAYPAPKLRALRAAETQRAMHLLGVDAANITFLQLPDGALPLPESPDFTPALEQCCCYLFNLAPNLIFVPWRFDPHPDHQATWHLISCALQRCHLQPRLIEYPIWSWDIAQRYSHKLPIIQWRLNISNVSSIKQQAIAAYRSQTTSLIHDDPQGFCLTPQMLTNFAHDWELYFEEE